MGKVTSNEVLESLILKLEVLKINTTYKEGKTLLTWAREKGVPEEIIKLLESHGAVSEEELNKSNFSLRNICNAFVRSRESRI